MAGGGLEAAEDQTSNRWKCRLWFVILFVIAILFDILYLHIDVL